MSHEWRGEDGHGLRTLAILVMVSAVVIDVLLATVWAVPLGEIAVVTAMAVPVALLGNGLLTHALRARLSIVGTTLQVRHTFGLRRVAVSLPCAIEIGEFVQSSFKSISSTRGDLTPGTGQEIGAYLRLGDRVTIATWYARVENRLAAIATRGPNRDSCDVELSLEAFSALEAVVRECSATSLPAAEAGARRGARAEGGEGERSSRGEPPRPG